MKRLLLALFMALAPAICLAGPKSVVVGQESASLYFREALSAEKPFIFVPEAARGLRWEISGADVLRVETLPGEGLMAIDPALKERERLSARLEAVSAAIRLYGDAKKIESADLEKLQKETLDNLPALIIERAELQKKLELFPQSLPQTPSFPMKKIVFALSNAKSPLIHYSYEMPDCGWIPVYEFAANLDKGEIQVGMFAEVRQFSGTDWKDAEITFVSGGGRAQMPPMRPWYLEAARKQARNMKAMNSAVAVMSLDAAPGMSESADAAAGAAPAPRVVQASNEGAFSSWKVPEKNMPQGIILTKLSSDLWKDSLEWVARPGLSGVSPAFMTASHEIGKGKIWPRGKANYGIILPDGNVRNVGEGSFQPKNGEAILNFGPDWQVTVDVAQDMKRRGETGLISTSNVWNWGWNYTVMNTHDRPVKVRVERPQALAVDEDIKVKYNNVPKAEMDAKDKSLFWLVDVKPNESVKITHQIEITAPQSMNFEPNPPHH